MPLEIEEDDAETVELSPIEFDNYKTQQDILEAFGEGDNTETWSIRVSQIVGNQRKGDKEPFLFYCDPSELPIDERLRDNYGSGRYRARTFRNRRLWKQFDIEILAPAPKTETAPTDLAAVIAALQQANRETSERMEKLFERLSTQGTPAATPDPFQQLERMTTIVKNLMPAQPQPVHQENSMSSLEMMKQIFEMAQEFGGGQREKGMLDIVGDLLKSPLLENVMKAAGQQQPMIAPQHAPMVAPPNAQQAPQVQPQSQAQPTPQQQQLVSMVYFLISRAEAKSNPGLYAEYVIDVLPPEILTALLAQQNIVMQLEQSIPAITPHRVWFQQLIDETRNLFDSGAPPAPDNEYVPSNGPNGSARGAGIDAGNAQADAGANTRG